MTDLRDAKLCRLHRLFRLRANSLKDAAMSAIEAELTTCDESSPPISPPRLRVDPPHSAVPEQADLVVDTSIQDSPAETAGFDPIAAGQAMLEVEEPMPELLAAVGGENLDLRREQLQLQVAQLAGHLRERLREVDRREAAVNARVAQLESD